MIDRLELHALADGELEGEERKRVEARLGACAESAAEYAAIVALKKTVGDKCSAIGCEATWAKCRKRIDEVENTRRIESFVGRYAWALCSIFVVLIFGAALMNRQFGGGVRAGDVPAMMSSLSTLGQVAPVEAERWIMREAGAKPQIVAPTFQVVERALGVFDGRKVVALRLRDSEGEFAVLLLPGAKVVDGVQPVDGRPGMSCGQMAQSNCVTWQEGATAVIVTGPRATEELCALADKLRQ